MKPGNRRMYGANSCRVVLCNPERWGVNKKRNSFIEGVFSFLCLKNKYNV